MDLISFEKISLPNGLDVILHQDRSLPLVGVNVWYHVGSKDEQAGKTGYAHLFEHLMFEGSKHHDKSYFEPLMQVGATLNGSTNIDRTNYWENLPSDYLELALWLESDRMGFLLDALDQRRFDVQRDVVKNERRQSYENRPYGMAGIRIQEALYPMPHTYHWPTIGYHEDLDAATLEDAHSFFQRFYTPSNASLAITGDFEMGETQDLVERYFGGLPPGTSLARTSRTDSSLQGPVHLTLYDRVLVPRLYLGWPTVPRFHRDEAALSILADILGAGKSSRLHRTLVYERRIAQSVGVHHDAAEIAGDFDVEITADEGHTGIEMEEALRTELERIRSQPPTSEEVTRAKNSIEWSHVSQMANIGGFGGRANRLNTFNVFAGNPDLVNRDLERFLAVEPEDVSRVAESYLGERQIRLLVLPEPPLTQSAPNVDRSVRPPPSSPRRFEPPVPQRHRLSNGLELLVVEKRAVPMVAFGIVLKGGASRDPGGLPGLANFTTAMLQEGTLTRSSEQIAQELEFIGNQLAASTGREHTLVGTESLARHFPIALELVSDLLQHPTFPEEELVRLGNLRRTALRRRRDDATALADLVAPAILYGRDSHYGHSIDGTVDLFESVSRDDLVNHFRASCGPENATLAVVGDVSLDEVVKLAEQHFQGWKGTGGPEGVAEEDPTAASTNDTGSLYLLDKQGAAQSVIRAGSVGVPRHHSDYLPLVIINHLFGGQFTARLNQNLRQDKGYSYGYRSSIDWHRGSSLFLAGGGVQTDVTLEAVVETLREFSDIRGDRPVGEEEFLAARTALLRQFPSSFETCWQVLQQLTQMVLFDLPDDYYRTLGAKVEAVSLADVQRVARERVESPPTVLVVGDRDDIESGLSSLGLPMHLVDHEGRVVQDDTG